MGGESAPAARPPARQSLMVSSAAEVWCGCRSAPSGVARRVSTGSSQSKARPQAPGPPAAWAASFPSMTTSGTAAADTLGSASHSSCTVGGKTAAICRAASCCPACVSSIACSRCRAATLGPSPPAWPGAAAASSALRPEAVGGPAGAATSAGCRPAVAGGALPLPRGCRPGALPPGAALPRPLVGGGRSIAQARLRSPTQAVAARSPHRRVLCTLPGEVGPTVMVFQCR